MFQIINLSILSVLVISLAKLGSSIMCYDCNSEYDPRCGANFDPFSLGVVNCSLKDPLEHLNNTLPTFCRSIKMEINGKLRVVRKCGYIQEVPGESTCQRKSGIGDVFVTYCSCNEDLCNTASSPRYQEMALIVPLLFLLLNY